MATQLDNVPPGVDSTPGGIAATASPPAPVKKRFVTGAAAVIVRRVIGAIISLFAVLVFNFFLFRVLPGDPARTLARNRHLSAEQVIQLRQNMGLDKPLGDQFLTYLNRLLVHGDLGDSFSKHIPVAEYIGQRIWPTVLLVGVSTILSMVFGLWIGVRGAWQRGSAFDKISNGTSLTLYSMPIFWLGIVLLMLLAGNQVGLGLFPTGGIHDIGVAGGLAGAVDVAHHLFLPCLTLTLAYLAEFSLVMRSSLLDEMGQDYLTTARAKGLRDLIVRRRHAVPNALLPTATLIFLHLGFIISGALTVEIVYSWPGLGTASLDALEFPDFPLLQGIFLLFAASTIIFNLIGDLLLGVLDPRVREA